MWGPFFLSERHLHENTCSGKTGLRKRSVIMDSGGFIQVVIVDFGMKFWSMVVFMVK